MSDVKSNLLKILVCVLFTVISGIEARSQSRLNLYSDSPTADLTPYIKILKRTPEGLKIADIVSGSLDNSFKILDSHVYNRPTEWLKFSINHQLNKGECIRISVAFSDSTTIFIPFKNHIISSTSGDFIPFSKRKVKVGQICILQFNLPEKGIYTCYMKLSSNSKISYQFKDFSIRSLKIYSEKSFKETFDQSRIYQAFFYGAVCIMFCFNFFIFLSTRSSSYFYYLTYLFFLILFLASNSGYLLELIWPEYAAFDLYVRFVSAPLLIIAYLQFSKDYLKSTIYTPFFANAINILLLLMGLVVLIELAGFWKLGRSCFIILSMLSFLLILINGMLCWKKGYTPALYFLAGNVLLIMGSTVYAAEHLFKIAQNSSAGFILQSAVLIEVALFSLGLADRINMISKELGNARVEKERREKEVQIETKKIIEEKNRELQLSNQQLDAFIYRTAHDIRGPLASLMGLCQIALIDVKDGTSLDYLGKLNFNANKMNYILERLNTAYEISNVKVKKETILLESTIQEIIHELRFLETYEITLFQIEVERQLQFQSDRQLIKFILFNIIENAVKFRDPNQQQHLVKISIKGTANGICAEISDNGIGIPEEDKSDIYDLFSKAAVKHKNPGLGLYMVKLGLLKLNGTIVHSSKNEFTLFSLMIPEL